MIKREIRCAAVDLSSRSVKIKKMTSAKFNSSYSDASVALVTGILTGTGAPGTGVMSWRSVNGKRIFTEGRLGAYLRYAGLDALVINGAAEKDVAVRIADGAVQILEAVPDMRRLCGAFKTNDTCIAMVSPTGVVEDDGFCISDAGISKILSKIGVAAIVAVGTGYLPIADSRKFTDLCVELYRKAAVRTSLSREDLPAVRFLSVQLPDREKTVFEYAGFRDKYAGLGIHLGNSFSNNRKIGIISDLVSAVTGTECSESDIAEYVKGGV
ncbi:MAG: hypothetical protein IJ061_10095 [Lachnospiraceae bacterium]|nr:hypothetical protein [Lachnospiraceae bacterium]